MGIFYRVTNITNPMVIYTPEIAHQSLILLRRQKILADYILNSMWTLAVALGLLNFSFLHIAYIAAWEYFLYAFLQFKWQISRNRACIYSLWLLLYHFWEILTGPGIFPKTKQSWFLQTTRSSIVHNCWVYKFIKACLDDCCPHFISPFWKKKYSNFKISMWSFLWSSSMPT